MQEVVAIEGGGRCMGGGGRGGKHSKDPLEKYKCDESLAGHVRVALVTD